MDHEDHWSKTKVKEKKKLEETRSFDDGEKCKPYVSIPCTSFLNATHVKAIYARSLLVACSAAIPRNGHYSFPLLSWNTRRER